MGNVCASKRSALGTKEAQADLPQAHTGQWDPVWSYVSESLVSFSFSSRKLKNYSPLCWDCCWCENRASTGCCTIQGPEGERLTPKQARKRWQASADGHDASSDVWRTNAGGWRCRCRHVDNQHVYHPPLKVTTHKSFRRDPEFHEEILRESENEPGEMIHDAREADEAKESDAVAAVG